MSIRILLSDNSRAELTVKNDTVLLKGPFKLGPGSNKPIAIIGFSVNLKEPLRWKFKGPNGEIIEKDSGKAVIIKFC